MYQTFSKKDNKEKKIPLKYGILEKILGGAEMTVVKIPIPYEQFLTRHPSFNLEKPTQLAQYTDPTLAKVYEVYEVTYGEKIYLLKQTNDTEITALKFLQEANQALPVPSLRQTFTANQKTWLLREFYDGETLEEFTAASAQPLASALGKMTNTFYTTTKKTDLGQRETTRWEKRKSYLTAYPEFSAIIQKFLARQQNIPQTFVTDDLLPLNVLNTVQGPLFFDWDCACWGSYVSEVGRFCAFFVLPLSSGYYHSTPEIVASLLQEYYAALLPCAQKKIPYETYLQDVFEEVTHQYLLCIHDATSAEKYICAWQQWCQNFWSPILKKG